MEIDSKPDLVLPSVAALVPPSVAARLIKQQVTTLATWRAAGKGPAFYKVGRRVFYSRVDLDAWIASRRREPAKAIST